MLIHKVTYILNQPQEVDAHPNMIVTALPETSVEGVVLGH
jgi:hypothetical protein